MNAFVVTDGMENFGVLALFSSKESAEAYRLELIRRRPKEKTEGRPSIAELNERNARLPKVIEVQLDLPLDELPGAWGVRVDSRSRSALSAKWHDKIKPSRKAKVEGKGKFYEAEGYGATTQDAYYSARKALEELLEKRRLDSLERDQG